MGTFSTNFQAFLFIIKPKDVLPSDEQALESLNFKKRYKVVFVQVCHGVFRLTSVLFFTHRL